MVAKMLCPKCGIEMNFHAEKLIYSDPVPTTALELEGHLEEMYACPRCGCAESRRQPTGSAD